MSVVDGVLVFPRWAVAEARAVSAPVLRWDLFCLYRQRAREGV